MGVLVEERRVHRRYGGHARCRRRGVEAAFERGQTLLEGPDGRVGDARVDETLLFTGEPGRALLGAIKSEGGGLVDGDRHATVDGVRLLPGVDDGCEIAFRLFVFQVHCPPH